MYQTSDKYKTESRQVIRNQSLLQVTFSVIEPDAADSATVEASDTVDFADTRNVVYKSSTPYEYATLETNRFILDGSQVLLPESGFVYQGFVSTGISDDSGAFTDTPYLAFSFSQSFAFVGLTLRFSDHLDGDRPSEVTVKASLSGKEKFSKSYTVTGQQLVISDAIPSMEGEYVDKITVYFNGTRIPNRRIRVIGMTFGVVLEFDNETINSADWKRSISLISTELPTESMSVSAIDMDKNFSPEKPQGIYAYLQERQPLNIRIGYELNNGSAEWIDAGAMYTTSGFSVDANSSIPILSLEAQSTLLSLTETWDKGKYVAGGRTFYDLAKEMLDGAELMHPQYVLSDRLKQFTTTYPLPCDAIRNNLQLIANACMCVLYTDRAGVIHITPPDETQLDYELSFNDVFSAPVTTKYPVLYTVTAEYSDIAIDTETSELTNIDIDHSTPTLTEITYSMSTGQSISAGSGVTVTGEPTFYAEYCTCLLSGKGSVKINGKSITVNSNTVRKQYNTNGEDCPMSNKLITSRAHAEAYADWIAAFEKRRNEYEVEDRGYPEVDMADHIYLETAFTPKVSVQVIEHNISFDGGISGSTKMIIAGGDADV